MAGGQLAPTSTGLLHRIHCINNDGRAETQLRVGERIRHNVCGKAGRLLPRNPDCHIAASIMSMRSQSPEGPGHEPAQRRLPVASKPPRRSASPNYA
jgi:hypothetical protein